MEFDHDDDEAMSVLSETPADIAQILRAIGYNLEMEAQDR